MSKYRTGIIGLGRIGFSLEYDKKREQPAAHSKAFEGNGRANLAGGYDIDPERRASWQKAYPKAKAYDSMEAMLSDGRWDILVVAVDEAEHLKVMKEILPFLPHLIVLEKPVAPNYPDARKILKLANKYRVPVAVNHERRFSKDYLFVRDLINDNSLGELITATAYLFSSNPALKKGDLKQGQGCLIHDGTHILDILSFITSKNIRFDTFRTRNKHGSSTGGISAYGKLGKTHLSFHNGFETEAFSFELDMMFNKGRIRTGNGILSVWRAIDSPFYEGFRSLIKDESIDLISPTDYFSGMVQNCIDFLDGKTDLVSPLQDGVKSLKLVHKILKKI